MFGAMRRFVRSALFDFAQRREQIGCLDGRDGSIAESHENQCLERPFDFVEGRRTQLMFLQRKPLTRDSLESIGSRNLLCLPLRAGIDPADEAARVRTTLAGKLQWNDGIDPQREHFLLAVDTVLETPISRSRRLHEQKQAAGDRRTV
jgi:hypothetical protein